MMIHEDGDRFLGVTSLYPKKYREGDNVERVDVRAYENGDAQYIALRTNGGQRIYLDEAQVTELVAWLDRNGVIVGDG